VKKHYRPFLGALAVAAAALTPLATAAAAQPATAPAELTRVTLSSLTDDTGMPLWLAEQLGFFEQNGLDVEIVYSANGAAALPAGLAGDWQAGWIGAPPALTGWDKWGLISFPHIQEARNLKLMMRNDALEGRSPAEVLRNEKIGTGANSTFQNLLFACAAHFGVDPGELEIVPLDPPQVRQALAAGEIAAGTTSASGDFQLVQDTENYTKVCDGEMAGASFISVYMVTPTFLEDDPEAAAAFVEAVYRANEYVNEHPDEAVEYMLEYNEEIGLDSTEESARYTLESRDWVSLDDAIGDMSDGTTEETLTQLSNFFVDVGVYSEMPDVSGLIEAGLPVLEAAQELRGSD